MGCLKHLASCYLLEPRNLVLPNKEILTKKQHMLALFFLRSCTHCSVINNFPIFQRAAFSAQCPSVLDFTEIHPRVLHDEIDSFSKGIVRSHLVTSAEVLAVQETVSCSLVRFLKWHKDTLTYTRHKTVFVISEAFCQADADTIGKPF